MCVNEVNLKDLYINIVTKGISNVIGMFGTCNMTDIFRLK